MNSQDNIKYLSAQSMEETKNNPCAIKCFTIDHDAITKTIGSTDYITNSPSTQLLDYQDSNFDSQKIMNTINSCSVEEDSSRRGYKRKCRKYDTGEHPLMNKGMLKESTEVENPTFLFSNFEFSKVANKNQLLGSGAFGEVFMATNKVDKKRYAIKVMNKATLEKNKIKPRFIRKEIEIHSRIEHPYIITVRCSHITEESFFMVMDCAKNGTLYSKIKKMKNGFSEESAFKYFIQTCSAVYFLHKHNLVHRDLKPENLLLDENNNIKLTDFGWCDYFNGKRYLTETCGTYEYMAPEIIKMSPYSFKVDIWALGILLYELLHGETPFFIPEMYKDPSKSSLLFEKIKVNKYKLKEELSEESKDLIKGLLQIDPEQRMSMEKIFQHPWVISKEVNFRSSKRVHTVYLKPSELNFRDANEMHGSADITIQRGYKLSDLMIEPKLNLFENDQHPSENMLDIKQQNTNDSALRAENDTQKNVLSKYLLLNHSNQSQNFSRRITGEGQRFIDMFLATEENEADIDNKHNTLRSNRHINLFESCNNYDKEDETRDKNNVISSETSSKHSIANPEILVLSSSKTENGKIKNQLVEEINDAYCSTKSIDDLSYDTSKSGNSFIPPVKGVFNGELKQTKSASILNVTNKLSKPQTNKLSSYQNLIVPTEEIGSKVNAQPNPKKNSNFSPSNFCKEDPQHSMFNFNSIDYDLDLPRKFDSPLKLSKINVYSSAFVEESPAKGKALNSKVSPFGLRLDFSATVKEMPRVLKEHHNPDKGIYDSPDAKQSIQLDQECRSNQKSAKLIFKLQGEEEEDNSNNEVISTTVLQQFGIGDDYQLIKQTSKNKLVITSSIKKEKKNSIYSNK